jgi:hypothetical protein
MEGQAGKAAIVRGALAGQFRADGGFDDAVGEVAMHDGKARAVAAARLVETALLLLGGQFERQAVAAVPMAVRRGDQIGGDRLRHRRFGPAARRRDNRAQNRCGRTLDQATAAQRTERRHSMALSFGFVGKRSRIAGDHQSNA